MTRTVAGLPTDAAATLPGPFRLWEDRGDDAPVRSLDMSTTLFTDARVVLDDTDKVTEPSHVAVDCDRIGAAG